MSNGGRQTYNNFFNKIVNIKGKDCIFESDYILQEEGYNQLMTKTKNSDSQSIVIIGGSHSGFSSAWILLNPPSDYKKFYYGKDYLQRVKLNCNKCEKDSINANVLGMSLIETGIQRRQLNF